MKICSIISIVIALFVPQITWADFEGLLSKAQDYSNNKEYSTAIDVLKEAIGSGAEKIDEVMVYNAIGWNYFLLGDQQQAVENLDKAHVEASSLGKDKYKWLRITSNNLGLVYYSEDDYGMARKYFENEYSKNSEISKEYIEKISENEKFNEANSYIKAGIGLRQQSDFRGAVIKYDEALKLIPENARALEFKGYALYRMDSLDEASAVLMKALSISPQRINIYINILKVYCKRKDGEAVKKFYSDNKQFLQENRITLKQDVELKKECVDYIGFMGF